MQDCRPLVLQRCGRLPRFPVLEREDLRRCALPPFPPPNSTLSYPPCELGEAGGPPALFPAGSSPRGRAPHPGSTPSRWDPALTGTSPRATLRVGTRRPAAGHVLGRGGEAEFIARAPADPTFCWGRSCGSRLRDAPAPALRPSLPSYGE
ncbi:hypothetical protein P7K49_001185 [Saguinus oedipus]|uniref:Uncharacterized protein n=1 Tax=Saguinus oedipus TaxID=9490 RepID=A0ABQ9WFM6_SAGOE|nr:hypothetical protein P7K49_001185 [Saguinus oedipus]